MITLYKAEQGVWGADKPASIYFQSIKDRNEYVKTHDYASKAGSVKVSETELDEMKRYNDVR